MNPLVGWLAFGRFDPETDVFVEAADYQRPAFDVTPGEIATLPQWVAIGSPAGFTVTHSAVFAVETGGHSPLAWWSWAPLWLFLPGSWAPQDVRLDLELPVHYAVNATVGTGETHRLDIAKGIVIGRLNGQAVTSGCRLTVVDGRLTARAQHHQRKAAVA